MEILSNGDGTYGIFIDGSEYTVCKAVLVNFIEQAQCVLDDGL